MYHSDSNIGQISAINLPYINGRNPCTTFETDSHLTDDALFSHPAEVKCSNRHHSPQACLPFKASADSQIFQFLCDWLTIDSQAVYK